MLTAEGERLLAPRVVLTTGTFLRGVVHIGRESRPAGPPGASPSAAVMQQADFGSDWNARRDGSVGSLGQFGERRR